MNWNPPRYDGQVDETWWKHGALVMLHGTAARSRHACCDAENGSGGWVPWLRAGDCATNHAARGGVSKGISCPGKVQAVNWQSSRTESCWTAKHHLSIKAACMAVPIVPMRKQSVLSAPQHHPPNQCDLEAKLPIFWSTWWRWGPDDGFFNSMDRFYGPIGWWA